MARISSKTSSKTSQKKDVAKVSNALIEAFVKKNNIAALKLIFYIAKTDIQLSDDRLMTISIDPKVLCEYCKIDIKTLKRNIRQMTETSISITDEKSESYITVIPYARFEYNGKLIIDIYKEVLNLIAEVRNRFTIIDVKQLMQLTSKHSIRMIALLEMISGFDRFVAKRKYYTLEELNKMFGTNYLRLKQFEAEILESVKQELDQNSKLSFEYTIKYDKEASRVGRARAVGITIDIIQNTPQGTLF